MSARFGSHCDRSSAHLEYRTSGTDSAVREIGLGGAAAPNVTRLGRNSLVSRPSAQRGLKYVVQHVLAGTQEILDVTIAR
jgi:hypothetical protein